jgi:formylglycine-generating enzyme required for sulfatase activity
MPLSGARPPEDDGRVVMTDEAGLALVLLPGGEAMIGSPERSPEGRRYPPNELPRQRVELAPFLLSKYELTQGQWTRLTGRQNPAKWPPREVSYSNGLTGLTHPIETVSWLEATTELAVVGLELPTEAQWEYACRAGRLTEWWFGDRAANGERDVLLRENGRCRFNAADGYVTRGETAAYMPESVVWPELDDGWVVHSFVGNGAFDQPNGFGLYAMHGNVAEMTRGTVGLYPNQPDPARGREMSFAPGDAELLGGNSDRFAARGGSFYKSVEEARCSWRPFVDKTAKFDNIGIRPARALDRR